MAIAVQYYLPPRTAADGTAGSGVRDEEQADADRARSR
jgi:hypothetical protein